jgi:hypothetical protein
VLADPVSSPFMAQIWHTKFDLGTLWSHGVWRSLEAFGGCQLYSADFQNGAVATLCSYSAT